VTPSLLLLLAVGPGAAAAPPADPRSSILVHERCASELETRDLTLFGNGTIRLREGPPGSERLVLRELGRPELEAIRRRIDAVDPGELRGADATASGEWTAVCALELRSATGEEIRLRYGGLDSGGLELDGIRRVVETLVELARAEAYSVEIPAGWRPAPGDRLERNDGLVFEVVGFTSDGKAIELTALDQPIQVFVARDRLRLEFRRRVPRDRP
jgi:hypothetical protein